MGLTILVEHLNNADNIEKVLTSSKCAQNYTFFVLISVGNMSWSGLVVAFLVGFVLVLFYFILCSLLFKILGYKGQSVFKYVLHYMYGYYCGIYNFSAHSYCSKLSDCLYVLSAGD